MSEFAARVSRVRMKRGGAEVRVLHNRIAEAGGEDHRGALLRNARAIADLATLAVPLVGYVLIGIYEDGATSVGFRYDHENRNAIPRALLPAWVAEVIRRDIISAEEARDVFDRMFEWRDG